MYHYFVSYSHERGFGCCQINRPAPIRSHSDIGEIQKILEVGAKGKLGRVVILYWKPFELPMEEIAR